MNPFITHPSVRIKGTEQNYEPTTCSEEACGKHWPHMHCPFCVKTEVFQDPVILKAHYRVKHVDKGIDFAGLKILRCCEHCDIVGTIKGTKEFKGAHWHCYKCRNGFTRRDEAIKHYRTHFRNPSTTFQIQVAQDINQSVSHRKNASDTVESVDNVLVETTVSNASIDMSGMISIQPHSPLEATQAETTHPEKSQSGEIQVSVAANETVGTCDGQTIMIIQEAPEDDYMVGTVESVQTAVSALTQQDVLINVSQPQTSTTHSQVQATLPPASQNSLMKSPVKPDVPRVTGHWRQEKSLLEVQLREIKAENSMLIMEKQQLHEQFEAQLESMRAQVDVANQEILAYQKREAELLNQLKIPLDDRINDLLSDLKNQHEELLHHQLAQLRRMYMNQLQDELGEGAKSTDHDEQMISAKDVDMSIVRSGSGETIGTVIAAGADASNMVLTAPHMYTSLPSASLNASGIVLTSETLMGDNQNTPLFVMSHSTLQEIKTEDHIHMEASQNVIMEEDLLEGADPGASLEQYTGDEQPHVLTSDGDNISEKLLLGGTVHDVDVSQHLSLSEKSGTIEITLNHDMDTQQIAMLGKRKFEDDSSEHSRAKQQREED